MTPPLPQAHPGGRPPTPVEHPTQLWVNGQRLVTLQTTPLWLDDWAVGFLYTEGLIARVSDILDLEVDPAAAAVRVTARLAPTWDPELATRRYLTSGCGKGVTFSSVKDALLLQPPATDLAVPAPRLAELMAAMADRCHLYQQTGGIHGAAVAVAATGEMVVREDIGRHNAMDKALGAALRRGWDPQGLVALTSGRISYEMCTKLARCGIAIGASRTAATDQAVRLAARLGMALVGYLRRQRMVVYTGQHRILQG